MSEKLIRKDLRRRLHPVGWTMVLYYLLMLMAVNGVVIVDLMFRMIIETVNGADPNAIDQDALMNEVMGNAWGYILAFVVGLGIVLLWKKPRFFKEQIFARGRPMTFGAFMGILSVFLGVQLFVSLLNTLLETLLNLMGLSMLSAIETASGASDSFSMFVYASLCAPVSEELLFRGLLQRSMMPMGKKFAIFCSALLFGIFHGNLAQIPFAFLVGLVLGYVAAEYNILWAMVLHMVNNLILADMFTRVTSLLPMELGEAMLGLTLLGFAIAGLVVLIVNRWKIRMYLHQEKMNKLCLQAFFSHPGVIIMFVIGILSALMLIQPM